jgi:hypothetical protein
MRKTADVSDHQISPSAAWSQSISGVRQRCYSFILSQHHTCIISCSILNKHNNNHIILNSSMAQRSVRFGVLSRKLSNVGRSLDGWPKISYLEFFCASESTLSRWSQLFLQSLAPTNPRWAHVVGYVPFSLSTRKSYAPAVGTLISWW